LSKDSDLRDISFPFSKGWAFQTEVNGGDMHVFSQTEKKLTARSFAARYKKNAGSYWLKMGSGNFPNLDFFVDKVLSYQTKPFFLITTDGDLTVPGDACPASVQTLLQNPHLTFWYSQNAEIAPGQQGKIRQIPIGLDLHFKRSDDLGSALFRKFVRVGTTAPAMECRTNKIFVDLHLNFSSDLRRTVYERLKGNRNYVFLGGRVSQTRLWEFYASYKYVLSVEGNGLDCHRTWEALGLGCRVVTLTSPLDGLFETLPVYICKSPDELARDDLIGDLDAKFGAEYNDLATLKFSDFM